MASQHSRDGQSMEPQQPVEPEEKIDPRFGEPRPKKRRSEYIKAPEEMMNPEYKDWILDYYEDSQVLVPPDTYVDIDVQPEEIDKEEKTNECEEN